MASWRQLKTGKSFTGFMADTIGFEVFLESSMEGAGYYNVLANAVPCPRWC